MPSCEHLDSSPAALHEPHATGTYLPALILMWFPHLTKRLFCLSVPLSLHLSIHSQVCSFICLSIFILCPSVCLLVCLSVMVCPSVRPLPVCSSVSACPSVFSHLPISLFARPCLHQYCIVASWLTDIWLTREHAVHLECAHWWMQFYQ